MYCNRVSSKVKKGGVERQMHKQRRQGRAREVPSGEKNKKRPGRRDRGVVTGRWRLETWEIGTNQTRHESRPRRMGGRGCR